MEKKAKKLTKLKLSAISNEKMKVLKGGAGAMNLLSGCGCDTCDSISTRGYQAGQGIDEPEY